MKYRLHAFVAAALLIAAISCPGNAATIRVFAAASLTEAFREVGAAYQVQHPGDTVEFNFAGSPTLKTQIEQGAPADVFASADVPNMKAAEAEQLVAPSETFVKNTLVIVTPPASTVVNSPLDLAKPGIKLVLALPKVPAGHYAEEVLAKMDKGFGGGFAAKALANVVSREIDVKTVLSKAVLGEADACIVFETDRRAAGQTVKAIQIPAEYNVVAQYPIAVVTKAVNPVGAASFKDFVLSKEGEAILKKYGFH